MRGNGAFALAPGKPTLAEALRGARPAPPRPSSAASRSRAASASTAGSTTTTTGWASASGVHYEFAERRAADVVDAAVGLARRAGPAPSSRGSISSIPTRPTTRRRRSRCRAIRTAARSPPSTPRWRASSRRGTRGRRPDVVALTADHGEAFGEHGEESHSLFVYDVTLRVPLLVRAAGRAPPAAARRTPVSLADLGATLLALAGAPPALPGANLLAPRGRASPLYAETLAPRLDFGWSDLRSIRDGRYKLIRAPRPELYDVVADPAETRDLAAARAGDAWRGSRPRSTRCSPRRGRASRAATVRSGDGGAPARARLRAGPRPPAGTGADPKDKVEVALAHRARRRPLSRPRPRRSPPIAAIAALDPDVPLVNFRLADALLRAGRAARVHPVLPEGDRGRRRAPPIPSSAWPPRYAQLGPHGRGRAGARRRRSRSTPRAGRRTSTWARSRACAATVPRARRAYEAALARSRHPGARRRRGWPSLR